MKHYYSIIRRIRKILRLISGKKEVEIHGVFVPLHLVNYGPSVKGLDRGNYEGSEASLIKRHLPAGSTVVELGASLGIISSVIGKTSPACLFCLEPLPTLAATARLMLARNCPEVRYQVLEYAIAPFDGHIDFSFYAKDNLSGKAGSWAGSQPVKVAARRLSTILQEEKIPGPYYLVSDIEGMEAGMLLEDAAAFESCAGMILEAHETDFKGRNYMPDDIFKICASLGFKLIERRVNVAFLTRVPVAAQAPEIKVSA